MIRSYVLMLRLQIYGLFGINRILHAHEEKEKNRAITLGIAGVGVVCICLLYSSMISIGLVELGIAKALPTIMLMLCSIVILILTFLKVNGVLFVFSDYDMVMSLPVSSGTVILSRLTAVYAMNLLITLLIFIPAAIVFSISVKTSFSLGVIWILAMFFIPIIPTVAATALGAIITAVSVRMRYSNIVTLAFSVVAILAMIATIFWIQNGQGAQIAGLGLSLEQQMNAIYPPAAWFSTAVTDGNLGAFSIFVVVSLALVFAFVVLTARFYGKINTAIFSRRLSGNFRIKKLHQATPFRSLFRKEASRYLSCPIYALNSSMGLFLMLGLSLVLWIFGPVLLAKQENIADLIGDFQDLVPFGLAFLISFSSTTASSLSLEGKSRWLLCSAPIDAHTIYDAKIAFNLALSLPSSLIASLLFAHATNMKGMELLLLVAVSVSYSIFTAVTGMLFNVKFPKYDWANEHQAVKNSLSVVASLVVGVVAVFIPMILYGLIPGYRQGILIIGAVMILIIAAVEYRKLRSIKLWM